MAQSSRDAIKASTKPEHYLLDVDNRVVLPVDTRIRFLMTSNDVIHNWWVPALGVKQDGNPGYINDAWAKIEQEGTYRGQCAELCGKDHGYMPIVVDVVSKEKYKAWVSEQKAAAAAAAASASKTWSKDELMAKVSRFTTRTVLAVIRKTERVCLRYSLQWLAHQLQMDQLQIMLI